MVLFRGIVVVVMRALGLVRLAPVSEPVPGEIRGGLVFYVVAAVVPWFWSLDSSIASTSARR